MADNVSNSNGNQIQKVLSFRGLSLDQAIGYFEDLECRRVSENRVVAEEWTATLSAEQIPVGPTLRLTEITVTFEGEVNAVERISERYYEKAFRAPG